jgi:hypothetical protein
MSNDTTSDRLWTLDTTGVISAVLTPIIVRKLVFFPAAIDDDILIQDYSPLSVLRTAITLKANHTDVNPVALDFGRTGREINGFKLATIDGGTLYVYLGQD